ncbi:Acg family FMN-binding oxidoreductase [Nocardioides panacisoli]|uniref:NAD(P)H nitroreductase n=1 Tax=Nocardioides panacisoli TaxID=627624 RepID=A0ABP7I7Y7_9ACTN
MTVIVRESTTTEVRRRLVELACLAPSVHNTQPWSWRLEGDRVLLYADRTRALPVEDPRGRNLVLSCGTAVHHLRVAARALGLDARVELMPDGDERDLLASIELRPGFRSPTPSDDLTVLRARCTDRRRFTLWPVPAAELEALAEEARSWDCTAIPILDLSTRFRVELLTLRAQASRSTDAAATSEQRAWVGRGGYDGIPREVLPERGSTSHLARFATEPSPENPTVVESGDGVIVLGGPADGPIDWLRTGEGLSALWLRATRAGMSVVPLSLPIEVEASRTELQHVVVQDAFVPHLLVRIGWQAIGRSELPRTPRRPVAEVLKP